MKNFEFDKYPAAGKQIPRSDYGRMGLTQEGMVYFAKNMEELRERPTNLVIAECVREMKFHQNNSREQLLQKKKRYVMGFGIYRQLWYDTRLNQKVLKPAQVKFNNVYRPYMGQDLSGKTLLVSRTGGIGDLLFIQPNLIHIKEQYPDCTILFSCGPQYHPMVRTWDCIDELLELPFLFSHLVKSDYHAIFEGVIERCDEAKDTNAYELFTRWLGLNLPTEQLVPKQDASPHRIEEAVGLLKQWGIKDFLLLQIRASSPIRSPSPRFWKSFIDKLTGQGHNVVITDSSQMADKIAQFVEFLDNKNKVFNHARQSTSLSCAIAMAKLAKCVVGTDSSMVHIGASLGTPIFGIYGPFPGKIRLTTYPNCDWIEPTSKDIPCTPCFTHGSNPCTNSDNMHPICYNKIDVDLAVEKLEILLKKVK